MKNQPILLQIFPYVHRNHNDLLGNYHFLCISPPDIDDEETEMDLSTYLDIENDLICMDPNNNDSIYGFGLLRANTHIATCYDYAVKTKQSIAFLELIECLAKIGVAIERQKRMLGYHSDSMMITAAHLDLINEYLYMRLEEMFKSNSLISMLFNDLQRLILKDEDTINEFINLFMAFGAKTLQELGEISVKNVIICEN